MKKLEQGEISGNQLQMLLINTVLPTSILLVSTVTVKTAGRNSWLSILVLPTIYTLVVIYIVSSLGMRFPGKTLMQYSEDILGKWLGKVIGLAYIFYFVFSTSIMVREFGGFMITAFMPETPLIVFNAAVLLIATSAVRNGLEVIARVNQYILLLMIFMLMIIFSLIIGEANLRRLLPIIADGIKPVMLGSLTPMGWRGEMMVMAMLMPYVNIPHDSRIAGYKAVLATAQLLNLKEYRSVVMPLGVIIIVWSITSFVNTGELFEFIVLTLPAFLYFFQFFIPLLLILLATIQKKGQVSGK